MPTVVGKDHSNMTAHGRNNFAAATPFTWGRADQERRDAVELLARIAFGDAADSEHARAEARSWLAYRGCHGASAAHIDAAKR